MAIQLESSLCPLSLFAAKPGLPHAKDAKATTCHCTERSPFDQLKALSPPMGDVAIQLHQKSLGTRPGAAHLTRDEAGRSRDCIGPSRPGSSSCR